MNPDRILVIGDDFSAFAGDSRVMRVSELRQRLFAERIDLAPETHFVVGQGVADEALVALAQQAERRGLSQLAAALGSVRRSDLTHKAMVSNVLIAPPRCIDDATYLSALAIGPGFSGLSDHLTGQHISGMLALEAARQATIAIVEQEYFARWEENHGLVLYEVHANFKNYLFPTPCEIRSRVEERGFLDLAVTSDFSQHGVRACTVVCGVQLLRQNSLLRLEAQKAAAAIQASLAPTANTANT